MIITLGADLLLVGIWGPRLYYRDS
jgi:hypothetical protein